MPASKKRIERRKHRRFLVKNGAVTLLSSDRARLCPIKDLTMGEIAVAVLRSKPENLGKIKDISIAGLSFHYIENAMQPGKSFELDILFTDGMFCLANVPIRIISDFELAGDAPFDSITTRRGGVQFGKLSADQISQLEYFIRKHTTGEA